MPFSSRPLDTVPKQVLSAEFATPQTTIDNGIKLPSRGKNFTAYSSLGITLGRTYVHSKVGRIIEAAYRELETSAAGKQFMYGETGWFGGGRIKPHRTHRNGLSVDFMVPVVNTSGNSVLLPVAAGNKYGYAINFDKAARYKNFTIDFEALAEHLYQLDSAAKASGDGIALVIFDPPFMPKLLTTKRGEYLKRNIKLMKSAAWVRHDEHYHVDFAIPCKAL